MKFYHVVSQKGKLLFRTPNKADATYVKQRYSRNPKFGKIRIEEHDK